MKILLIEDNVDLNEALERALKKLGHRVDSSRSFTTGMEFLERNTYDLAVTDLYSLSGKIRPFINKVRQNPEAKVLFISAAFAHELERYTKSFGADGWCEKDGAWDGLWFGLLEQMERVCGKEATYGPQSPGD